MPRSRRHHPQTWSAYDAVMIPADRFLGLNRQRRRTVAPASGRVLEVGMGTGLNLPHYLDVVEVVGVEPDPANRRRAEARISSLAPSFPLRVMPARAEALPFPDAAFDTVVICLVLCTVEDPLQALREAHRVLAPDGQLLLLEHVRSRHPVVTWWQHALTPIWRNVAGGCHLDRQTITTAEAAGFRFEHLWRSRGGRGSFVQGRARPIDGP